LLWSKRRPSERKLKDRTAARARRREAEPHQRELDAFRASAHNRPEIVDSDVVGPRQIELGLSRRDNAERQILHQLAICGPGDVLLVVVAHGR